MDEHYNLKWQTFPKLLVGMFTDLGTEGNFADVTLVSDDQIQTKANQTNGITSLNEVHVFWRDAGMQRYN